MRFFDNIHKATFQLAFGFFLIAALLGSIMRMIYICEVPFLDYMHLLHTHSHLAMLGWGFTALAGALVFIIVPEQSTNKHFKNTIVVNTIAGIGMLIGFMYQGYGAFSIAFSTIHVFCSYYFAWHYIKWTKHTQDDAVYVSRWAVYWMLISTLGIWAVPVVSILLGKLHPLYFSSIQFFLHFQFNGWFIYGVIALLLRYLSRGSSVARLPKGVFLLIQVSLVLTYTLIITWNWPEQYFFYINSAGVLLQAGAFILLWKELSARIKASLISPNLTSWILRVGILSFIFKIMAQSALALPVMAKISYTIRNFIIGFIHMTMLGAFSMTLIAILLGLKFLPTTKNGKRGYFLLMIGFVVTELLLFSQGIVHWLGMGFIPYYHQLIFWATIILPMSLILICKSFYEEKIA